MVAVLKNSVEEVSVMVKEQERSWYVEAAVKKIAKSYGDAVAKGLKAKILQKYGPQRRTVPVSALNDLTAEAYIEANDSKKHVKMWKDTAAIVVPGPSGGFSNLHVSGLGGVVSKKSKKPRPNKREKRL